MKIFKNYLLKSKVNGENNLNRTLDANNLRYSYFSKDDIPITNLSINYYC